VALTCIQLINWYFVYRLNDLKGNDVALTKRKLRAFEKEVAEALLNLASSTARSSEELSLAESLLSLSVEKIDAIDANEDTSVINSGCGTGGDESDEDIKEPNTNSSPLECFSPISTGKHHSTRVCNKLYI
jgi:hypothetical protein